MKTFYLFLKTTTINSRRLALCVWLLCLWGGATGCRTPSAHLRIKPGKHIEEVKLGLSPQEMENLLGTPLAIRPPKAVIENYKILGINPESKWIIQNGFDKQIEYLPMQNPSDYPVFTVYYKAEKAVYIILSSYIYPLDSLQNIYIKDTRAFGHIASLLRTLGNRYIYTGLQNYDGQYLYLTRGISFISERDRVRAIHIYKPLKKKQAKAFIELIRQK